jgi:hypothetical protein
MSPSVPAFGSALGRGLGRAMILLRQEPDSPALQAELMRACKASLLYDGYFEHYRAPYLHRLIRAAGQERRFGHELSRWLAEAGSDDDSIDTAQALHVLCLLAADDAAFDRAVLHDFVRRATYDMTGVGSTVALIRLEGIEALLLYVRRFADEIADEAWSFEYLVEALGEREGPGAAAAALEAARAACPELDRLMALDPNPAEAESAKAMDYAAAKEALAAGGRRLPWAWVRHASPEELAQAAGDLLAERDARKLRAYVGLFLRREFPAPAASLLPLVRHEDNVVAKDAAQILGRLGGSGVRALALELLDGERPWNGIRMLRCDPQPGDFRRIGTRLAAATLDADGWHDVGHSVFDLLEEVEAPPEESRAVLLRLYEEEPCSFCRETVVRKLAASGGLPGWLAEECRYDAEPDTVSLASQGDRVEDRGPAASG